MFALRRAAARAVFTQPVRQLSTLRPAAPSRISTLRSEKPTLSRSFHQSWRWFAEEEQKKPAEQAEASPAEAQSSSETVTTEPSAEEQKEIKEESIATPDVVEAAQETAQKTQQNVEESASKAEQAASSVTETVQDVTAKAAESVQNAASTVSRRSAPSMPRDAKPSRILYVGNLFFEVTAPQLEEEFGKYGELTNSRVVTDSRGNSKGFGYIEFASQEDADRAVRELDQRVFQGRRMAVQYHVRREPRISPRAARDPNPPSKTLFIGNMSYQMSDRDLNDLFREIRNVLDVRVAIDRRTGQPRGFAHADFIDVQSAQRAKEHLEKKEVYGRQLRVDYSQNSSRERTMGGEMDDGMGPAEASAILPGLF